MLYFKKMLTEIWFLQDLFDDAAGFFKICLMLQLASSSRSMLDDGWLLRDLLDAGWLLRDLLDAGWLLQDLLDDGWLLQDLLGAGCRLLRDVLLGVVWQLDVWILFWFFFFSFFWCWLFWILLCFFPNFSNLVVVSLEDDLLDLPAIAWLHRPGLFKKIHGLEYQSTRMAGEWLGYGNMKGTETSQV